MKRLETEMEEM